MLNKTIFYLNKNFSIIICGTAHKFKTASSSPGVPQVGASPAVRASALQEVPAGLREAGQAAGRVRAVRVRVRRVARALPAPAARAPALGPRAHLLAPVLPARLAQLTIDGAVR